MPFFCWNDPVTAGTLGYSCSCCRTSWYPTRLGNNRAAISCKSIDCYPLGEPVKMICEQMHDLHYIPIN